MDVPTGARPPVQCAACESRFDAEGAVTGDRVRCPMCGEVVQVADVVAARRRVPKSPPAPRIETKRLTPGDLRRVYSWLFVAAGAGLLLAAIWMFRDSISSVVHDVTDRRAKPR